MLRKETKAYLFTDEKLRKLFELVKSKGLLQKEEITKIDGFEEYGDYEYKFQSMNPYSDDDEDADEGEDTGEYKTTVEGFLLEYNAEDSTEGKGYEYTEEYFLTNDGIMWIHSPGDEDPTNEGPYFWGYITGARFEHLTSLSSVLDVIGWDSHNVDDKTLDEIEDIFKL